MAKKVIHVIGNGDNAVWFDNENAKGLRLICNKPVVQVNNVHATCIVDFKFMRALTEGDINMDAYTWVLGYRPKVHMEKNPSFHMKHASHIKEFYLDLPKYAGKGGPGYTNFNCGHFATHYAANKLKADEIHMYGFDCIFDFTTRSMTDFFLGSDRGDNNTVRLTDVWRKVFAGIFKEFSDTKFVLHHKHDNLKIPKLDNMEVIVHSKKKK